MSAVRVLVVADDLTGAADACVGFVACGYQGSVVLDPSAQAPPSDVVSFSTDTRRLGPAEAARRVSDLVLHAAATCRASIRMKKIDSTLRGHVGVEIGAALEAWGARAAIVAPSFAAQGRSLEDGVLRFSALGSAVSIDVPALLGRQGLGSCPVVERSAGLPSDAVALRLRGALEGGARVIVCDAVDDQDLDALIEAVQLVETDVVWAGSAGLAAALARYSKRLTASTAVRSPNPRHQEAATAPVVFWIGSNHPITMTQRQQLLEDPDAPEVVPADRQEQLERALDRGRHVLVEIDPATPPMVLERATRTVAGFLVAGFMMSGGDTAAAVCRALGGQFIRLGGEVECGTPWGWLVSNGGPPLRLVLKSGGFGGPASLVNVMRFLTGGPRNV